MELAPLGAFGAPAVSKCKGGNVVARAFTLIYTTTDAKAVTVTKQTGKRNLPPSLITSKLSFLNFKMFLV